MNLISFVWSRIWDASTVHKTSIPKFILKDLANNKVAIVQGKLLLEII
jgi:hypothetical protein